MSIFVGNGSGGGGGGISMPAGAAENQGLLVKGGTVVARDPDMLDARAHFGLKGDGTTDDTAAMRTLAAAVAAGCNKVRFPRGTYLVDTTAGAIFSQGANVAMSLEGDGAGNVGGDYGTIIKRTAGTAQIILAQGSGDLGTQRAHVQIKGIAFHGGGLNGPVLELDRANECNLEDVRIQNCAQTGFLAKQLWNSRIDRCFFYDCGSGTSNPATIIGAISSDGALGNTQTLQMIACQWEANTGTDLSILGDSSSSSIQSNIQFVGCKWERQVASATYPVVTIDYAGRVNFVGGDMSATGTSTTSQLIVMGADMDPLTGSVLLSGINLLANTNYYIVVNSGTLAMSGCQLSDSPSGAYVQANSGVGLDAIAMAGNVYVTPSAAIEDNRGSFYGFEQVQLGNFGLTGSAAYGSVGSIGTIDMPDGATSGTRWTGRLPSSFRSNQQPTLRITYSTTVAGGNIRWQVNGATYGSSTDLTVAGPSVLTTAAAPGTANREQFTDFVPATGGISAGNNISYEIQRLGSDAADTNTGTVQIINVNLSGTRRL